MKNKILFFTLCIIGCSLIVLSSCKPDYETEFEVKTLVVPDNDLAIIKFGLDGGQKNIRVETNLPTANWKAVSNADWCKVEKGSDKVVVSAVKNNLYVTRNAVVTISYGHQSYEIPVKQSGNKTTLLIEGKQEGVVKEVSAEGGELSISVSSNMVVDNITIPAYTPWVSLVSVVDGTNTSEITVKFKVEQTFESKPRESVIQFQSSDNFGKIATFTISQKGLVFVEVPLDADMLSANATENGDGQGLPGLTDNNKETFYHSLWSAPSPDKKPHYVQINLKQPLQLLRFAYVSRDGGNGDGDVKRAGIWVSETGADNDAEWKKAATITFNLPGGRGVRTEANQTANLENGYKFIRFIPEARRNADPIDSSGTNGWWNMADLFLYTAGE